ncbi:MAG TPA: SMI1/KNR4 family protein [Ktedonobacteraceae bacterium]|nr:SMI1/KNR4 family protein [Ktedonobacteraceae bacterium]
MKQQPTLDGVWGRFVQFLASHAPAMVEQIRTPAKASAVAEAEQRLGVVFPEELRQLYLLADGFVEGAYLLRDDYRILPLDEMVEASLALVGEPIMMDGLLLQVAMPNKVIRLLFAQAREDDPDVKQVSVRLRSKLKPPLVELWFREGGIHDWEEVVETGDTLTEWIEGCLEYYD